jgi:hypothetical protein
MKQNTERENKGSNKIFSKKLSTTKIKKGGGQQKK